MEKSGKPEENEKLDKSLDSLAEEPFFSSEMEEDNAGVLEKKLDEVIKQLEQLELQVNDLAVKYQKASPDAPEKDEKLPRWFADMDIKKIAYYVKAVAHITETVAEGAMALVDTVKEKSGISKSTEAKIKSIGPSDSKLELSGILESVEAVVTNFVKSIQSEK